MKINAPINRYQKTPENLTAARRKKSNQRIPPYGWLPPSIAIVRVIKRAKYQSTLG
jgi:hypothetical protein